MNVSKSQSDGEELLSFAPEAETVHEPANATRPLPPWRILVIDDDPEVHQVTRFALNRVELFGRQLELIHGHSAVEAAEILRQQQEIAVILLDVVMESDDAGLKLVDYIRQVMKLPLPRIILRTGQPGYAPELDVMARYDINDYRTKSELTQNRMIATLTAALRSYDQLRTIMIGRAGMQSIIEASADLINRNNFQSLLERLPNHMQTLVHGVSEWMIALLQNGAEAESERLLVAAASDKYRDQVGKAVSDLPDDASAKLLLNALQERHNQFNDASAQLCCGGDAHYLLIHIEGAESGCMLYRDVLSLFARNVSLCADIVSLIEKLEDLAYRDPLTGLPNRARFIKEIEDMFRTPERSGCVALMDVDHFNALSSTIGIEAGDQLLINMTSRLLSQFENEPVSIARISGDTFGLHGPEQSLRPERLQQLFAEPVRSGDSLLPITVTTGMAPVAAPWENAMSLIGGAYAALRMGKNRQRGAVKQYTAEMTLNMRQRMDILRDLRSAVETESFFLAYQPQLSISGEQLLGFEALIRWRRPDGKLVPPDLFIPIAETSGLICSIGAWVFERACRTLRALQDVGLNDVVMGINVSIEQLRRPDFIPFVQQTLEQVGIRAEQIEIEVTETMAMQEIELVLNSLNQCKQLGLRIAMDDFGTGFSSLAHLQCLPIGRMKVDRAFVVNLDDGGHGKAIAQTISHLGQHLDLDVLAEGVETHEQLDQLRQMGYHSVQGYLFGRPMPYDELVVWLNRETLH